MRPEIGKTQCRVGKGHLQASSDGLVNLSGHLTAEAPPCRNAAERYGEPGCLFPPLTEVLQSSESLTFIGEAAFMNNNTAINFIVPDALHNPVKSYFNEIGALGCEHTKQHCRSGIASRYADTQFFSPLQVKLPAGNHQRAAAPAKRASG